jgi:hypothetical protein
MENEMKSILELIQSNIESNLMIAYYTSKEIENFPEKLQDTIFEVYKDRPLKEVPNFDDINTKASFEAITKEFESGLPEALEKFGLKLKSFTYKSEGDFIVTFNNGTFFGLVLEVKKFIPQEIQFASYSVNSLEATITLFKTILQLKETDFFRNYYNSLEGVKEAEGYKDFICMLTKINFYEIRDRIRLHKWELLCAKEYFSLGNKDARKEGTVYLSVDNISKGKGSVRYLKQNLKHSWSGGYMEKKWVEYNSKTLSSLFNLVQGLIE